MELVKKIINAPNWVSGDNKLSRAGAFLFAFTVLHALPNFLLLKGSKDGLQEYQDYADNARQMNFLPVFEVYLALSFIVHIYLAGIAVWNKGKDAIGLLFLTGCILLFFIITHLLDFRFGGNEILENLTSTMPSIVSRKKVWYIIGIVATGIHAIKAIRIAWFMSLGFRGNEIPPLLLIGKALTVIAMVAYVIPIIQM
jgi:succinate dehydrogenase/fumarate reductase cytochrome b subunit